MRVQINLASKPFVELRPIFQRLRIAMAALGVLAVALGIWLHIESGRAAEAQRRIDGLKAQTAALQQERTRNEARMRQPQNAAALDRSRFLNELFTRKGFSWTAVMMDLENVLPAGVQVSSIEPQVGSDGEVHIRLRVMGDRDRAVDLIRNLEHSKRFLEPRLASESLQQSGQGGFQQVALSGNVEFDILSGYNPLAPKVKPADEKKQVTQTLLMVKPSAPSRSSVPARPLAAPNPLIAPNPGARAPQNPAPKKGGAR